MVESMASTMAEPYVPGDTELVICATLYGAMLSVFGLLAAGWGHGPLLPAAVFGAPLSLVPGPLQLMAPLLWWPFVAYTMGSARRPRLGIALMALHAAVVVLMLMVGTPYESAAEQWEIVAAQRHAVPLVLIGMIVYVIGQAATWSLLLVRWVSPSGVRQ